MLLAAPARGQRPAADEPHASILLGELSHDRVGAVGRGVVEYDHLQIDVAADEDGLHARLDRRRLVSRRHQH